MTSIRTVQASHRRGVALLIALGTLIVAVTATTILLASATIARIQREMAADEIVAQDLLIAVEAPIQHWLEHESSKVILPANVSMPMVSVLRDQLALGSSEPQERPTTLEICITAFDQCGMVPIRLARSGSPLRLSLPAEALQRLDALTLPPESEEAPLGLDLFEATLDPPGIAVFPAAMPDATLVRFGDQAVENALQPERLEMALGGLLATHNDPIRININTAPIRLVEAALRAAGGGGGGADLEPIIVARNRGEVTRGGSVPDSSSQRSADSVSAETRTLPQLVGASNCWSFRIDLHVGRLRTSWWATYIPGPDDPDTPLRESWRSIQRLAITQ